MTALYVPPTGETDQKKQNQSIQLIGGILTTAVTNTATNTTNIATNTTNIATNTASIAAHEAAWTAYTPTVSALAGTYTTSSASGKYLAIGKTVHLSVTVTITTVGTGTFPQFTLPVAPSAIAAVVIHGWESGITAKSVYARGTSGSVVIASFYDATNPAASGAVLKLSGIYEAA